MKNILSWLTTPFIILSFFIVLVVFHILQIISIIFSKTLHKHVVDLLNFSLIWVLRIFNAAKISLINQHNLALDRPLIIVSNHQNLYDPPLLHAIFYKHHPKYVSKIELSKWIPSVSFNLRHGGSLIIDRSDKRGSLEKINTWSKSIGENNYAAVIFPEGTRAKDGKLKEFKSAGVISLLKNCPTALVVPVCIDGSWQIMRNKLLPVPFGLNIRVEVLAPIEPKDLDPKEIVERAKSLIKSSLGE